MDDQSELERLGSVCTELKKTVEEDLQNRKKQDKWDKRWQLMTLFLPIIFTSGVGWVLSNGQARLQETIATSEEFNTHRLSHYEDLDTRALTLKAAIQDLYDVGPDGDKMPAIEALTKLRDPVSGLYFDAEFDQPIKEIIDLVSNSKYLSGGDSDIGDKLDTDVRGLETLMLKKLGTQ
jgi:hypothetical protein